MAAKSDNFIPLILKKFFLSQVSLFDFFLGMPIFAIALNNRLFVGKIKISVEPCEFGFLYERYFNFFQFETNCFFNISFTVKVLITFPSAKASSSTIYVRSWKFEFFLAISTNFSNMISVKIVLILLILQFACMKFDREGIGVVS